MGLTSSWPSASTSPNDRSWVEESVSLDSDTLVLFVTRHLSVEDSPRKMRAESAWKVTMVGPGCPCPSCRLVPANVKANRPMSALERIRLLDDSHEWCDFDANSDWMTLWGGPPRQSQGKCLG